MKNQLTLLLTLKDRSTYTERWLDYALKFSCPFSILIADGSNDNKNEHIIEKYKSKLPIQYLRYPPDRNFEYYYRKVVDAVSHVTTQFVIKADNDDFYDFAVLSEGVKILIKNDSYTSFCPRSCNFRLDTNGKIFFYPNYAVSAMQELAQDRLKLYFNGAQTAYYNIHTTSFYLKIWKEILAVNFSNLRFHELLIDTVSYAQGKIFTSNSFGYIREASGQGGTAELSNNTLKEMLSPYWGSECAKIAKYISDIVTNNDKISHDEALTFYYNGIYEWIIPSMIQSILNDPKLSKKEYLLITQTILKNILSALRLKPLIKKLIAAKNSRIPTKYNLKRLTNYIHDWHSLKKHETNNV